MSIEHINVGDKVKVINNGADLIKDEAGKISAAEHPIHNNLFVGDEVTVVDVGPVVAEGPNGTSWVSDLRVIGRARNPFHGLFGPEVIEECMQVVSIESVEVVA